MAILCLTAQFRIPAGYILVVPLTDALDKDPVPVAMLTVGERFDRFVRSLSTVELPEQPYLCRGIMVVDGIYARELYRPVLGEVKEHRIASQDDGISYLSWGIEAATDGPSAQEFEKLIFDAAGPLSPPPYDHPLGQPECFMDILSQMLEGLPCNPTWILPRDDRRYPSLNPIGAPVGMGPPTTAVAHALGVTDRTHAIPAPVEHATPHLPLSDDSPLTARFICKPAEEYNASGLRAKIDKPSLEIGDEFVTGRDPVVVARFLKWVDDLLLHVYNTYPDVNGHSQEKLRVRVCLGAVKEQPRIQLEIWIERSRAAGVEPTVATLIETLYDTIVSDALRRTARTTLESMRPRQGETVSNKC